MDSFSLEPIVTKPSNREPVSVSPAIKTEPKQPEISIDAVKTDPIAVEPRKVAPAIR